MRKNASATPPPSSACSLSAARNTVPCRSSISEVNLETPWIVAVTITLFTGDSTDRTMTQTP